MLVAPMAEALTPERFLEVLTLPVWQATAAVRWLEGRVANRPKPDEITPEKAALTDADCVSQEILLVALRAHFPHVQLIVEEDTPTAAEFSANTSDVAVVIDPIDGTLRYLCGDGPYAILVGLEREGRVEAALVGLPASETLICARRGGGAEIAVRGGPFRPAGLGAPGLAVLVSYGLAPEVRARLRAAGLAPAVAAGGAIGVAPLLDGVWGALRMSRGDGGLSRRAWVAALPTLEAGARIEALDGPFPERYRPGVRGLVTARDAAGLALIRAQLALPPSN
jgi:hypothetical protein